MLRSHLALALALTAVLAAAPAAQAQDRYALANGCYGLKSLSTGSFAAKTADGGFAANADAAKAERFRMQATDLGRYLLYGKERDFLANGTPEPVDSLPLPIPAGGPGERIQAETAPSESGDWTVDVGGGAYALTLPSAGKVLAAGDGGSLVLADRGAAGDRARFAFEPLEGCADYPEAETNVTGDPTRGATAFGEVTGMVDAHMHMMAFEFLGGRVHCGRPWSPYGVATALQDCPDHGPNGIGAVGENTLSYGNPVGTHDTRGWPTFKDWPHHASLTHEQTYYKWVERSWRARAADVREPAGGQRGPLHGLSAQEELLQRDGRRAAAGQGPARAAGLHRRPERRPRQGLVPDRRRRRPRPAASSTRASSPWSWASRSPSSSTAASRTAGPSALRRRSTPASTRSTTSACATWSW